MFYSYSFVPYCALQNSSETEHSSQKLGEVNRNCEQIIFKIRNSVWKEWKIKKQVD
jgi:hypothetical protein